ncbi:MAG: HAD family phosphatase [Chthonomonadales bacterium]|nr:HAD family phosphatase [Chthonomonadales bacterium]
MQVRAVLFDLDGVLIDSSSFHRESWTKLGSEIGFQMTDAVFWETFGMPNRQIFPLLFGRALPEAEASALSERKEELFRALARGRLQALPGAIDLLRSLKESGFRLALGSSTPRSNVDVILETLGVACLFDGTVTADDVTHGKPNPEVFLTAAARVAVPPERCVVVEDAVVGVEAARAAGMRCLAVTTTHPAERLAAADRIVAGLAGLGPEDFEALLA